MKVSIAIERSLDVPAPLARLQPLMADIEGTVRRFPKLRRLRKLKPSQYVWEMEPIGSRIANISHEVVYGAHYKVDAARGELSWTPLPQQGNASIEGWFRIEPRGAHSRISFKVTGELRDVPVPLMYRLVAPAFIQGKFTRLVDIFLENTREALLQN